MKKLYLVLLVAVTCGLQLPTSICLAQTCNAGTVKVTKDTICANSITHLSTTGSSGTLQWQKADSTLAFTNIAAATSTSYNSTLSANTYFRLIATGTGCSDTSAVIKVWVFPDPFLTFTFNANGKSVEFIANGTSILAYSWDFGDNQFGTGADTIHVYDSLFTYNVCVTGKGYGGCSYTTCQYVTLTAQCKNGPQVATTPTGTSCGLDNGSADANTNSGTPPYSFLWSNNATTNNINNLASGNYTITVTDVNGCTAQDNVLVASSTSPLAFANPTYASCGLNNGSVALAVTAGMPPYNFVWSNTITTQNISNLGAGTYTVTVTDGNGCTGYAQATLPQVGSPLAAATATHATCGSDDGSVTLLVSGGISPYYYAWSNGATTKSIVNIAADTFSVTVTDANGCTDTTSAVVTCWVTGVNQLTIENACPTCRRGQWTIFPNPSDGNFVVSSTMLSVEQIEIYDLVGKKVLSTKYQDMRFAMSTAGVGVEINAHLPPGVYFVRLYDEKGNVSTVKAVISK